PALALGYHLLFVSTVRWTSPQEIPLVSRLFTVPALWGHYLVKLLVPVNICCRYPLQAPPSVPLQSGLAWLVFLAVSGWLFFRLAGGGRLGALALVFFAAGLLPTSGLVTISTLMADRYLYIPALGIFLAAGSGTVRLLDYAGGKIKGAAMPLALAASIGMAAITLARQRDWRDPVSLWSRVVEVYPGHSLAVFNLAFARAGRGENEKAIELYRRSIALDPSYGDAWANLATLLADRGETSRAVTAVERATALRPDRAEVWLKRGIIYAEAGMDSVALESFTRTVVLDDGLAWKGFYNRAMVLLARGNYRQALADFTEAVRLGAPDFEGSQWLKMASSLQRANLSVQAAGLLERGAQAGTLDTAGWRTLGNLQLIAGRNPQAVQSLLRAAALDSADFRAWTLLGVARHQAGQAAGAVEAYRRALALDTANRPEILNNLGLALQDAGDFPAAERAWLDALELDRNYLEARFNLAAFYIDRRQREPAAEQLREVRRLAAGRPQTAEYVEKIQSALDKLDNPTH
ncbi:MAG: tetratricopeptide repeat protein, partial [Candidatus Glassbacteria bacterium]